MKKKGLRKKELVFAQDEMDLKEVGRHWTQKDLLSEEGVFFLKDTVDLLQINSAMIKRNARELRQKNLSAWKIMGVRKIWNHWIIRMTVFAPYYKKHLKSKVHKLRGILDANTLLNQTGIYYLTDVCRYLPFSAHQLRYQAKNNPNSKHDYGLWKDQKLNAFIVEMEVFSKWVKRLWAGHFSDQKPKEGEPCNPITC